MPIYEYVCTACGSEFEAIQKFSDAPLTACQCGESGHVQRKLSLAAFQLKGGGWYKDKYSTGGSSKNGGSKDTASDSGADSSSASSDSGASSAPAHACGGSCACG